MTGMHDLLEEFQATIIATSTTSGTGDFVLSGSQPYTAGPDRLTHGQTVWYHRYYSDGTTSGSEWGKATVSTATSPGPSLTNKVVQRSTASPEDTAISWSTAETNVAISASPEMMTQFCKLHAQLKPTDELCVAVSGQSNTGFRPRDEQSPRLGGFSYPRLKFWGTNGSSTWTGSPQKLDRTALAWRDWDNTVQCSDWLFKYVGIPAQVQYADYSSPEEYLHNGSLSLQFCGELSNIMGRVVRAIVVTSGGAYIDGPNDTGWAYDPDSDNAAVWLSEEVSNAIAALPSGTGITAPHFFLWAQGEQEPSAGKNSAQYGLKLADFISACYDPNRWGWAQDGLTTTLVLDYLPGSNSRAYPDFRGHAVACEIQRGRARLVLTDGLVEYVDTVDTLHYSTETGVPKLVARALNMVAATSGGFTPGSAPQQIGRQWVDTSGYNLVDETGRALFWTLNATNSNSAPTSTNAHLNVAEDRIFLHKTVGYAPTVGGTTNTAYLGIHMLKANPPGDATATITLTLANIPSFTATWDIAGPCEDKGTYWSIPITNETGTQGATGLRSVILNNCYIYPDWNLASRSVLRLSGALQSLANSSENAGVPMRGMIVADEDGNQFRKVYSSEFERTATIDGSPATGRIWESNLSTWRQLGSIGDVYKLIFDVIGRRTTGSPVSDIAGSWNINRMFRTRDTSATPSSPQVWRYEAIGSTTVSASGNLGSPSPTFTLEEESANGGTIYLSATVPEGESWDFMLDLKIRRLEA